MKINAYLPDDIAKEAKAAGLNFSRILRDAVQQKLATKNMMETAFYGNGNAVTSDVYQMLRKVTFVVDHSKSKERTNWVRQAWSGGVG